MKKVVRSFNYILFFIFISIAAFLTAFVYLQLMQDLNNSSNKEGFTIPRISSTVRPMIRNARLAINRNVNSVTTKVDNYLKKNKWIS